MSSRTVVVAVDGSAHAKVAFQWYLDNVWRPTDNVVITHIPEPVRLPSFSFKNPLNLPSDEWQKMLEESMQKVKSIEDEYQGTCVAKKIQYKIAGHGKSASKPGEGILAVADEESADLIIMGSRGLHALQRTFLGSVSDYIVHNTKIPVIVLPNQD